MSSTPSRHVFIWTLPAAVLLIGFWWYRKKRAASDPGGTSRKHKPCISLCEELLNAGESVDSDFNKDTVSSCDSIGFEDNNPTLHDIADLGFIENTLQVKSLLFSCEEQISEQAVHVNSSLFESQSRFNKVSLDREQEKQKDSGIEEARQKVCGNEEAKQEDPSIEEVKEELYSVCEGGLWSVEASCSDGGTLTSAMARKSSLELSVEKNPTEEEVKEELCSVVEGVMWNIEASCSDGGTLASAVARKSSLELSVEMKPMGEEVTIEDVSTQGLPSLEQESIHSIIASADKAEQENRAERDSANHSPADVMLASPSMSNCSDVQSEGSSDSGKGCSDVATPPPHTPASGSSVSGDPQVPSVFEFLVPQNLVGRLIGRHGCFVQQIKAKSRANIFIKRHPETQMVKVCAVEGTAPEIENALAVIREKFPARRYPEVTLEQVCFVAPPPTFPVIPDYIQLNLIEGVTNDVILSSLVTPVHFFLQHPTHPTFPSLNRLNGLMNLCYNEPNIPGLLQPLQAGIICAAPTIGGWYRAQVVSVNSEADTCEVKFIDYGGYLTIESSLLKQIRSDFMNLPFQAAECYLASLCPVEGSDDWSQESIAGMEALTHGQVLQAHICGYAEDGNPFVYLYSIHGSTVIFVNEELVNRGLAQWWTPSDEEETV